MTIHSDDIKILKADTNTDTDYGGGLATGIEVIDGEDNNVFPDISQLDEVYGRIQLRKVFPSVLTNNKDTLFGAHFIFTAIPENPRVHICAFQTTKAYSDRRLQAKNHLEQYLAAGVLFIGDLMEKQLQGQRAISLLTNKDGLAPNAGQTLLLIQNEGLATEFFEYVRVLSATSIKRTFSYGQDKEKELLVHTCEISSPLKNTFQGFTPQEFIAGTTGTQVGKAKLRETRIADASKYYSARPLSHAAVKGNAAFRVDTIYTYLVPSAQSETPLVDLSLMGRNASMVTNGTTKSFTTNLVVSGSSTVTHVGSGIAKASLNITLTNQDPIFDDGSGLLFQGGINVGTIRYDTGLIQWVWNSFTYTGSATFSFKPAFPNAQAQFSDLMRITEVNRGLVYVYTLNPRPERGTLQITYTYNNKNYIIYDNGDGTISGVTTGIGTGTIDYDSGTFNITLNAYPDVGTALIFQWGDKLVDLDTADIQETKLNTIFAGSGLSSLSPKRELVADPTLKWTVSGSNYTATVNRTTGAVTGDATGVLTANQQDVYLKNIAPVGTVFTVDALLDGSEISESKTVTGSVSGGIITFTNVFSARPAGVHLKHGSLRFNLSISMSSEVNTYYSPNSSYSDAANLSSMTLFDVPTSDPNIGDIYNEGYNGLIKSKQGTVNYSTGVVTLEPVANFQRWRKVTKVREGSGYYGHAFSTAIETIEQIVDTVTNVSSVMVGNVTFNHSTYSEADVPTSATVTLLGYSTPIKPTAGYSLDPSKTAFKIGIFNYSLNEGIVLRSTMTDNTLTPVGTYTLDAEGIKVKLDAVGAVSNGIVNLITWMMVGVDVVEIPQNFYVFMTPINPIRSGSFQLNLSIGGTLYQFVADEDGFIQDDRVYGSINYLTGLVELNFVEIRRNLTYSNMVALSASNPDVSTPSTPPSSGGGGGSVSFLYPALYSYNSTTDTYDAKIPEWGFPSAIKYNAIGLTFLPLDSNILGLDPVRLPADGRVPCFRPADVVVLSKTLTKTLPSPIIGLTGNMGDVLLSVAKVTDAEGKVVGENEIHINLDTGDYEVLSGFVASNFVAPITLEAKAQDMALATDVQVSGMITLSVPLLHDYPVGSLASSAIILGDKVARTYNVFEQQTWNTKWLDVPEGAAISAKYNYALAPITVENEGAIKERWALVFTSPSTFNIVGETVGIIGTGNTASETKPVNPAHQGGQSYYFTIPATIGFGTGWVNGNVIRFNTEAASDGVWLARTILQGQSTRDRDGFTMQLRGDIDNET